MQTDSDPDADSSNGLLVLVLVVLLFVMAVFSAAETAILSSNKNKMKYLADNKNKKAAHVIKYSEDENKFLLITQLGLIISLFLITICFSQVVFGGINTIANKIDFPYIKTILNIASSIVFIIIIMVFGVLFPKRIGNRFSDAISLFTVSIIRLTDFILKPIILLITLVSNFLVKITNLEKDMIDDKVSEDEIISIIETGVSDGSINYDEQVMIESVFKFNDLEAMDVMTPRVDVFMIDLDDELDDYIDELIDGKYTRIPVYRDYKDNIIGIVNVKDLLKQARHVGFDNIQIESIIRKPLFVPDSIKINVLFKKMKETKNHMAILSDQYGGFVGIATLEDLIEEIMGEIDDEFDDTRKPIVKIRNNTYVANASIPIQDLNKLLDLDLEEDNEDYDSLGGLVLKILDRVPDENEKITVTYKNIEFTILKMDVNRIEKVKIIIK